MLHCKTLVWILHQRKHKLSNYDKCDHALKHSLTPSSSFSPGGSLTGRGTGKDLNIRCCSHSPSKTNAPLIISHNAPCTRRPLWSMVMRKHRNRTDNYLNQGEEEKKVSLLVFCFYHLLYRPPYSLPHSLSLVALHLREASGFIYPSPGRPEDPCALSGCRVWASVWVLVVEKKSFGLPTSLSGPSQSSHPPLPLLPQAPDPSQMPWSMVSVVLHLNWKILNRFIQKLQHRQPPLRFRRVSWQMEKRDSVQRKQIWYFK